MPGDVGSDRNYVLEPYSPSLLEARTISPARSSSSQVLTELYSTRLRSKWLVAIGESFSLAV